MSQERIENDPNEPVAPAPTEAPTARSLYRVAGMAKALDRDSVYAIVTSVQNERARTTQEAANNMKCTACGSSSLVVGTIMGSADGSTFGFYPSDVPALKRVFGIGGRAVQTYGCVHCRNLQFTVEFSERDLERYQEFEGEQPDVLERINSNPKKLEG